jgi:hypothetical protein
MKNKQQSSTGAVVPENAGGGSGEAVAGELATPTDTYTSIPKPVTQNDDTFSNENT